MILMENERSVQIYLIHLNDKKFFNRNEKVGPERDIFVV